VVRGINLISLVWTDDGQSSLPGDYRIYNKVHDGLDKNDYFGEMLEVAHARGFTPSLVAFDGGYSSLDNRTADSGVRLGMAHAAQKQPQSESNGSSNAVAVRHRHPAQWVCAAFDRVRLRQSVSDR